MHFVAERVLNLLLLLIFSDHHVVLGDLLHLLAALDLAHPRLAHLPLEDALTKLSLQLVSPLLLLQLLLLDAHEQVALLLIS